MVLGLVVCQFLNDGALVESVFLFAFIDLYLAAVAVGMWKSQAALLSDFSKRLREATLFVAFRMRVISTAGWVTPRLAL